MRNAVVCALKPVLKFAVLLASKCHVQSMSVLLHSSAPSDYAAQTGGNSYRLDGGSRPPSGRRLQRHWYVAIQPLLAPC